MSIYSAEWASADRDGSGRLNFNEISKLLNKLNLGLKDSELKQKIKVFLFICNLYLMYSIYAYE